MLRIRSEIWRRRRHRWYSTQTRHDRRGKIAQLLLVLTSLAAANVVAMMVFEGLSLNDSIWLTMTTMTTVGYGDFHADSTPGRISTIVLMYIFGIFLLAQIAGEWFDYRVDRKEKMRTGHWRWNMNDHIVIINSPKHNGEGYLRLLVEQIRHTPMLADCPIQVLSPNFEHGLPSDITTHGVVLHSGRPEGHTSLAEVDVESARFIILMAEDTDDYRSDSLTLDVLDQLGTFDNTGHIIAECVLEPNRDRVLRHGANAVIRPVRAYPELMVRAMAAPGTEAILEDLFKHEGSHPRRYDVQFEHQPWGEVAAKLLRNGLGTPLGYLGLDNDIVVNPDPGLSVSGKAFFVMVSQDAAYEPDRVRDCLE